MGTLRARTSSQFTSLKYGCSFIYSESLIAPSLFLGSLHRSRLMRSFPSKERALGNLSGPLCGWVCTV